MMSFKNVINMVAQVKEIVISGSPLVKYEKKNFLGAKPPNPLFMNSYVNQQINKAHLSKIIIILILIL